MDSTQSLPSSPHIAVRPRESAVAPTAVAKKPPNPVKAPPVHGATANGVPSNTSTPAPSPLMPAAQRIHPRFRSLRSLRHDDALGPSWASSVQLADSHSVRSLASVGMGSSDGRKLTIRRVPTTPAEMFATPYGVGVPLLPHTVNEQRALGASLCSSASSSRSSLYDDRSGSRPQRRANWASKAQFVLTCVGYSVGLGTVWRFPYMCYRSGGGAFLIPYFVTLVLVGVPMLYLELAVGQFTKRGPIGALSMLCPLFKGAGVSSVTVSFVMTTYYNVLIAYSIYYLFSALRSDLPWASCHHRWNSNMCWKTGALRTLNASDTKDALPGCSSSEEFFEKKVLYMGDGIDTPSALRWELVACLLTAWLLVYFAVWKSVRSSGRMIYLTATLPFAMVLVFLGRALSLEGAVNGLQFFFRPDWAKLADSKVWVNALAQNFNSIGIALGSVMSLSSYNRFDNPILTDTLALALIAASSSMLVGLMAFATIGNVAYELNTSIHDVITDGPGLVFVLYSHTLAHMPGAQFWAVSFFFMMLCLGLNTQFALVEVVATSLQDGFQTWIKKKLGCHEMLVLLICVGAFLCGLPFVTRAGIFFFQLVDQYAASVSLMYLAFFELVGVCWLYGAGRLAKDVHEMTGVLPGTYVRTCWWLLSPLTLLIIWIFFLADYESPTFDNGRYHYPWWAETFGWLIASLSLAAIPLWAALAVCRAEGDCFTKKLLNAAHPYGVQVINSDKPKPTGSSQPGTPKAITVNINSTKATPQAAVKKSESVVLLPGTVTATITASVVNAPVNTENI